jgi:hypothetical protein
MVGAKKSVHLAGSELACGCHACAFFGNRDEEYDILLPFWRDGFDAGDHAFHVLNKNHHAERSARLSSAGIDVEKAGRDGRIEFWHWEEAYLRGGRFDQNAMLALIEEVLSAQPRRNGAITRLWANMEWSLEDFPGVADIVEYESRLNYVLPNYDDVVVCTYDLQKFSAAVIMDVLRTHPQVIIGGFLQQNPFYVPPDVFLPELRRRRTIAQ